jgi:ABC-type sugar transport system permease subunit
MTTSRWRAWLLTAPLLATLLLLLVYPTLYAIRLAFTDPFDGSFPSLGSVSLIVADPLFWRALRNNALLPLASILVELGCGLLLALFLSLHFRGRRLLRVMVVLPFALPEIVVLIAMRYILAPHGYANAALQTLRLGHAIDWLQPGSALAFLCVVAVDAWHVTPVVYLILLAGLGSIPDSVYEAARLDGAGPLARLRLITLPLLKPALLAALLLRGVDAVRLFATPLVLTGTEGVPVLSTYAYHQWSDYGNDTAAAAAAAVLALLSILLTLPLLRRRVAA